MALGFRQLGFFLPKKFYNYYNRSYYLDTVYHMTGIFHFTCLSSITHKYYEVGTMIMSIFQMRKSRLKEVERPREGCQDSVMV